MPTATETIALERQALMRVMDTQPYTVPSRKLNENLIIATWNIKHFSNRHTNREIQYIADICERFDIIALQEVKTDLRGLQRLQQRLPGNYRILVSDPTGNYERFAFLYDNLPFSTTSRPSFRPGSPAISASTCRQNPIRDTNSTACPIALRYAPDGSISSLPPLISITARPRPSETSDAKRSKSLSISSIAAQRRRKERCSTGIFLSSAI
jgi:hypothetical protein